MKEIIDWVILDEKSVRFFLGKNGTQWGDDWNDAPYEHNAGGVYGEYVEATTTVNMAEWTLYEPSFGSINSQYSKEDMINGKVPILALLSAYKRYDGIDNFEKVLAHRDCVKVYMGDRVPDWF